MNDKKKKQAKEIIAWISCLILSLLIALSVNRFVFTIMYIPSSSMIPTLNIGDRVITTRTYFSRDIKRGDIVVFNPQEDKEHEYYTKRVIGMPGDRIRIVQGDIYINDELLNEPYVKNKGDYCGSYVVPKGKYFLLGDNRTDSLDSRFWNNPFLDISRVKYIAQYRIYPFDKMGELTTNS